MTNETTELSTEVSTVEFSTDFNKDGIKSAVVRFHSMEAVQEAIAALSKSEGAETKVNAIITFKMEGDKAIMTIDTDKDGEPMFEVELALLESFKEAAGKILN